MADKTLKDLPKDIKKVFNRSFNLTFRSLSNNLKMKKTASLAPKRLQSTML